MGRASRKLLGQGGEIDPVAPFECPLAQEMLFRMMIPAQADRAVIMRLKAHTPGGAGPYMRAFDRDLGAARY